MCLAFTESEREAILSVKEKVIETGLEILKYQKEKREKCRESARIGGLARVAKAQAIAQETLKRSSSNTEIETQIEIKKKLIKKTKKKPIGFIPPSLQDIQNYCQERKNSVDAKKFFDYYSTGNWKDAKGNQVKNWKQKLLTWEGRGETNTKEGAQWNTNESLTLFCNNLTKDTLIESIGVSPSNKAVLKFKSKTEFDKFISLEENLKNEVKKKISEELGTNGFEPKY